jgi:hypothetical protein
LDAKSRERVNSDLTQVGIGTQLDSFLLIVVQTCLPQPGSLTIVIVIVIIINRHRHHHHHDHEFQIINL